MEYFVLKKKEFLSLMMRKYRKHWSYGFCLESLHIQKLILTTPLSLYFFSKFSLATFLRYIFRKVLFSNI